MKEILLVLMEALVQKKKSLVLILVKQTQNISWGYNIMLIIVICLLMKKKSFEFKANTKNVNFPTQYCLGSISKGFSNTEFRNISWNWKAYDFSVNYNSIDKSDIINIHRYLITKNDIK